MTHFHFTTINHKYPLKKKFRKKLTEARAIAVDILASETGVDWVVTDRAGVVLDALVNSGNVVITQIAEASAIVAHRVWALGHAFHSGSTRVPDSTCCCLMATFKKKEKKNHKFLFYFAIGFNLCNINLICNFLLLFDGNNQTKNIQQCNM